MQELSVLIVKKDPGSLSRSQQYLPFDRVADSFDRTRVIPTRILTRAFRVVFRMLPRRTRSIVIDAGVGTGRVIRPLFAKKLTMIGVDISLPMLQRLRQRYETRKRPLELHLILADVAKLPLRESSVGLVQSTHVLHLLKDWRAALLEWQRILIADGSLIIFQESGRRSSVMRVYWRELERTDKTGTVRHERRRGSMLYLEIIGYLRRGGWRMRRKRIAWRQKTSLRAILSALETRSFSTQWDLKEEVHAKALVPARAWVRRKRDRGAMWESVHRALDIVVASR